MKAAAKKVSRDTRSGQFVIEKKGSQLFIDGNRILDPIGRTSVSRSKLRAAVREVAGRKK